jgi:hypothetical protein
MTGQERRGPANCSEVGQAEVQHDLEDRRHHTIRDSVSCGVELSTDGFSSMQFKQSDILTYVRKDTQSDSKRMRIVGWLAKSLPDPSIELNDALKKHEETTGSWLIDGEELKTWSKALNSSCRLMGMVAGVNCFELISKLTRKDAISQKVDNCLCSLVTRLCSKRRYIPRAAKCFRGCEQWPRII